MLAVKFKYKSTVLFEAAIMLSMRIRMHRRRRLLHRRKQQDQQWMWLQQAAARLVCVRGSQVNFHAALAPVLTVAQCFALMPVCGIYAASPLKLNFCWRCWRTWYGIFYIFAIIVDTALCINLAAHSKLSVRNVEPIFFRVSILLGSHRFFRLALRWPGLMRHWVSVEQLLPSYGNWHKRHRLTRRLRCIAFTMMALALMEHILSVLSAFFYDDCPVRANAIESYLYNASLQIFHVVRYSNWLGIIAKLYNVLLTFGWSYIDIFVIILGIGLREQLACLTFHIRRQVEYHMPESFWTYNRTRYRLIVELILELDNAVSGLMLLSFGSNLYFVCLQLLKSIHKMPTNVKTVYFYFSLSFLIGRSVAVVLFVSSVNDRAREPLNLLRRVPASSYYDEVSRFASELANDTVALSGLKFFSITRKLFLAVAGSIATYELVLIQFHEDEISWDCNAVQARN